MHHTNNWLKTHGLPMSRRRYRRKDERFLSKSLGSLIYPNEEEIHWSLKRTASTPMSKITLSKDERGRFTMFAAPVLGSSDNGLSIRSKVVRCDKNRTFIIHTSRYI